MAYGQQLPDGNFVDHDSPRVRSCPIHLHAYLVTASSQTDTILSSIQLDNSSISCNIEDRKIAYFNSEGFALGGQEGGDPLDIHHIFASRRNSHSVRNVVKLVGRVQI